MLEVRDLHFSYGREPVLEGVSFDAAAGVLCGLFGPNGSGKTTLFRCCLNFLKYRGRVSMQGQDASRLGVRGLARLAAYVPQEHKPPFPYLVREVVLMGRTPHLGSGFAIAAEHHSAAEQAMEQLGLSGLASRPYNQLSSGQRQMVLLARALAQDTPLMFLDEPTSALDFKNQMRIWGLVRDIAAAGKTVVVCSHDPNHVAWYCDTVVMMNRDGIAARGAPRQVMTQEVLDKIYRDVCHVTEIHGRTVILPAEHEDSAAGE